MKYIDKIKKDVKSKNYEYLVVINDKNILETNDFNEAMTCLQEHSSPENEVQKIINHTQVINNIMKDNHI